jgi:hypothetical protein
VRRQDEIAAALREGRSDTAELQTKMKEIDSVLDQFRQGQVEDFKKELDAILAMVANIGEESLATTRSQDLVPIIAAISNLSTKIKQSNLDLDQAEEKQQFVNAKLMGLNSKATLGDLRKEIVKQQKQLKNMYPEMALVKESFDIVDGYYTDEEDADYFTKMNDYGAELTKETRKKERNCDYLEALLNNVEAMINDGVDDDTVPHEIAKTSNEVEKSKRHVGDIQGAVDDIKDRIYGTDLEAKLRRRLEDCDILFNSLEDIKGVANEVQVQVLGDIDECSKNPD